MSLEINFSEKLYTLWSKSLIRAGYTKHISKRTVVKTNLLKINIKYEFDLSKADKDYQLFPNIVYPEDDYTWIYKGDDVFEEILKDKPVMYITAARLYRDSVLYLISRM